MLKIYRLGDHNRLTKDEGQASPPRLSKRTLGGKGHSLSSEVIMLISVGTALTNVTPRWAQIPDAPPRLGTS